jgi:hypothetical protein
MLMAETFNPLDYVIRTRGQRDYLEVKYRVLWLRRDYPTARVRSECLAHTDSFALFRVTVDLGEKGYAEGHGSEWRESFANFIERAETRALGNALDNLGYSTDAAFLEAGQKPPLEEQRDRFPRRDREATPPPAAPRPDYDGFWREVRAMGFGPGEVLGLFGVRDLRGVNLEEAMAKLREIKAKREAAETPKATPEESPEEPAPA